MAFRKWASTRLLAEIPRSGLADLVFEVRIKSGHHLLSWTRSKARAADRAALRNPPRSQLTSFLSSANRTQHPLLYHVVDNIGDRVVSSERAKRISRRTPN